MTKAEADMMERIHTHGKILMLNDENLKLFNKMMEATMSGQIGKEVKDND